MPDIFTIKGLAAGIKVSVRTLVSDAHENKTLAQIAQKICDKHGFTLQGVIGSPGSANSNNVNLHAGIINSPNVIRRVTQYRETDLAFLHRISEMYGYVFSVRNRIMTFTNIYDLEKLPSSTTIFYSDFVSGPL